MAFNHLYCVSGEEPGAEQVKVAGEWKYQPRLVSWYGPCAYQFGGLTMQVGPPATSYMTPGNSFLTPDT